MRRVLGEKSRENQVCEGGRRPVQKEAKEKKPDSKCLKGLDKTEELRLIIKQYSQTLELAKELARDKALLQLKLNTDRVNSSKQLELAKELARVSSEAKRILLRATKMRNPFYYAAVKKRQADPFQYRYDRMLNKLRISYSINRFLELMKVLSRSSLSERADWLRRMEDAAKKN